MLLRRVVRHVSEQNWIAVGIDFFIVVVGVFIGIQAANWNDVQEDRRLGEDYTERLKVDLTNDLASNRNLLAYFNQVLASVEETDRLLQEPNADSEALVVAAYRASEFISTPMNSSTWDQIVSSGQIGLLPNSVIENGLLEYYKFQGSIGAQYSRVLESPYRDLVRSIIPLPVQLAIRESCSDILDELNNSQGFVPECTVGIGDAELAGAAEAVQSSEPLRAALRNQYSTVFFAVINSEANIVQIERILDEME